MISSSLKGVFLSVCIKEELKEIEKNVFFLFGNVMIKRTLLKAIVSEKRARTTSMQTLF